MRGCDEFHDDDNDDDNYLSILTAASDAIVTTLKVSMVVSLLLALVGNTHLLPLENEAVRAHLLLLLNQQTG